jgi:hypothetical protein
LAAAAQTGDPLRGLAPAAGGLIAPTQSGLVAIGRASRVSQAPPARITIPGAPLPLDERRRSATFAALATAAVVVAVGLGWAARATLRRDSDAARNAVPPAPLTLPVPGSESPASPEAPVNPAGAKGATKANAVPHVAAGAFPRSCAEARASGATVDGTVRIDPDGNGPLRPFEVFCADMGDGHGPPREYVTLPNGELSGHPEANATQFVWLGGTCECPDLVRRFSRVRIDPATMTIDPRDGTFSTYNRSLACETEHPNHCGDHVELAWGSPGSCRAAGDASARASIDLRGTPFALAPSARFVPAGFGAAGEATIAPNRKTATMTGGGQCGTLVPSDATIAVVERP